MAGRLPQESDLALAHNIHVPVRHAAGRVVASVAIVAAGALGSSHEANAQGICEPGYTLTPVDADGDGIDDYTRCLDANGNPPPANPPPTTHAPGTTVPNNGGPGTTKPNSPTTTLAPTVDRDGDSFYSPEGRVPDRTLIIDVDDASPGLGQAGIDQARSLGIDVDIPDGVSDDEVKRIFRNITIAATVNPADWDQLRIDLAAKGEDVMTTTLPPTTTTSTTTSSTTTTTSSTTVPTTLASSTSQVQSTTSNRVSQSTSPAVLGTVLGSGPGDPEEAATLTSGNVESSWYIWPVAAGGVALLGAGIILVTRRRDKKEPSNKGFIQPSGSSPAGLHRRTSQKLR